METSILVQSNIFVIGAQCTGKTTLVNALESSFAAHTPHQPPMVIREVARTVLKEKAFSRDDITSSKARALQLQQHILEAQFHAERTASTSAWYICDRSGLDPIAYTRVFVGKEAADEMLACEQWVELERGMKKGIVVLCEAGCSWLVDDGTRLMPTGLEEWMRVDKAFRELLQERDIGYFVIPKDLVNLEERILLVKDAAKLGKHGVLL
jgi:nicotinamide riboside kinase